jgi:hypothetical protein
MISSSIRSVHDEEEEKVHLCGIMSGWAKINGAAGVPLSDWGVIGAT